MRTRHVVASAASLIAGWMVSMTAVVAAPPPATSSWDAAAATRYLDERLGWFLNWPSAARDHGTACVSCHTALPYAIASPVLRRGAAATPGAAERQMLANVTKRVQMWREVEPFYPDQTRGIPKSSESRGTESVLNAVILSTRDAATGLMSAEGAQAFANMWTLQMRTGPTKGAWTWLNFGLEPWEAPSSTYFGASLAALAVSRAPGGYATNADIQPQLTSLKDYLRAGATTESLFNRLMIAWGTSALPGVLDAGQRQRIANDAVAAQNADGGWSMAALAPWKRQDGTTIDPASDGFATALTTLALRSSGTPTTATAMQAARRWLVAHQDRTNGAWPAMSVNKLRDPATDVGKFMTDAATAYATLALSPEW